MKEARGGSGWNITLSADIDLAAQGLRPVGNSSFDGTFDGAGHTVTLRADETAGENCALIGKAGTITVRNVTVNGEIYNPYYYNSAGIVANAENLTAENCVNNADVSGKGAAGGIVGICYGDASFTNCCNTGTIAGDGYATGGVAGKVQGSAEFTDCTNAGIVFCSTLSVNGLLGGETFTDKGGNMNTGSIVRYDRTAGTDTISVGEANAVPDGNGDISIDLAGSGTTSLYNDSKCIAEGAFGKPGGEKPDDKNRRRNDMFQQDSSRRSPYGCRGPMTR